jgi:hypothetical protein
MYLDPTDEKASRFKPNVEATFHGKSPSEHLNALQALDYCRQTISSNASADVKAVAYCWLIHLVGDLHQPLHCNELVSVNQFPKGDKGGNEIPLKRGKDLHALWDNLLGTQHYLRDVDRSANELSDKARFGDIWESATSERDPQQWADESHAFCVSDVYSDDILQAVRQSSGVKMAPIDLPGSYYKSAGELARKRVLTAGLRLAVILNSNATSKHGRRASK